MNVYKLYRGLLVVFMAAALEASQPESSPVVDTVYSLSNDRIHNHKIALMRSERNRSIVRGMGTIAAVTGASMAITKWLTTPVSPQLALKEDFDKLQARVNGLEKGEEKKPAEAPKLLPVADTSWTGWFKDKASGFGKGTIALGSGIAVSMFRTYMMGEAGKLIWPVVPSFGRYLFVQPTMVWSMTKQSKFFDSITSLCNWTRVVLNEPTSKEAQAELVMCTNQFVLEMEKIIGYMGFILDQLSKEEAVDQELEDAVLYRQKGLRCMQTIAQDVERLVSTVRYFASLGQEHQEKTRPMIETMHKILFSIICQMEGFEPVVSVVGYVDESEKDVFGALKGYVLPRWKTISLRPENYNDETEWLKDMAMDVINQALV